jgi:hypothetical protein
MFNSGDTYATNIAANPCHARTRGASSTCVLR